MLPKYLKQNESSEVQESERLKQGHLTANMSENYFLGPRGPLGLPSLVRPSARGQEKSGSAVLLYKSSQDHCQHQTLSGACLVASGGVCSMSGGVNVQGVFSLVPP